MFPWQREMYDSKILTSRLSRDASRQQMNVQQKKTVFLQSLFLRVISDKPEISAIIDPTKEDNRTTHHGHSSSAQGMC